MDSQWTHLLICMRSRPRQGFQFVSRLLLTHLSFIFVRLLLFWATSALFEFIPFSLFVLSLLLRRIQHPFRWLELYFFPLLFCRCWFICVYTGFQSICYCCSIIHNRTPLPALRFQIDFVFWRIYANSSGRTKTGAVCRRRHRFLLCRILRYWTMIDLSIIYENISVGFCP